MVYNRANLKALYGLLGTVFADNNSEEISEGDFRQAFEDLVDSLGNITDDAPLRFGGLYAFPGGAMPVATKAGTVYVASANRLNPGDDGYIQEGIRFMSLVDGANTFAQYTYW